MIVLMVNHEVEDYDKWKAVFDEFPPSWRGGVFHRINRNVDNPNSIRVVSGFESVEAATAFRDSPELKAAMGRAGVTSAPRIEMFNEVESVQY